MSADVIMAEEFIISDLISIDSGSTVGADPGTGTGSDKLFCLVCNDEIQLPTETDVERAKQGTTPESPKREASPNRRKTRGKPLSEADTQPMDISDNVQTDGQLEQKNVLINEEVASNYRKFLSEVYHINFQECENLNTTKEEKKEDNSTKKQLDVLTEFPMCTKCFYRVKSLYEDHQKMIEYNSKFETQRDDFATTIVNTFVQRSREDGGKVQLKGKAAKTAQLSSSEKTAKMLKKWKNIYTGEWERQMKLNIMIEEKELELLEKQERAVQVKKEVGAPRTNVVTARHLALMQKAMTACYFTPKLSLIRKRNKLYFEITVPRRDKKKERHICTVCKKEYPRAVPLEIHMRIHAKRIKIYKCTQDNCKRTFSSRRKFRRHKIAHDGPQVPCDLCNKLFRSKTMMRTHMRREHSVNQTLTDLQDIKSANYEDLFTCQECSKVFLKANDLNEHLKVHLEPNLHGCEYCGKAFSSSTVLNEHMGIHFGSNPYICDECGIRFASEALLISHLKTHRPKAFVCSICDKACRSRDGLRKHELTHAGDKPYICNVCGVGFIERKSLDTHMSKHTGKLPFTCSICKEVSGFKDAKDLRRHRLEYHPDLVPNGNANVCEFCWNSFPDFESLQDHVSKVHERYKCHVCSRVFKLGDHLRRHMYIHTGEKPFKCKLCDKMFNQESNLKEHMYRHTGIRPHQCPHCPGVGYLRRVQLKEHMLKEHGTDEVPSLPMGRAAQNARKSGVHPVPEPLAELVTAQSLVSSSNSNFGGETILPLLPEDLKIMPNQIPFQGQIVLSSNGTPVLLRKVTMPGTSKASGSNIMQNKMGPIIMRSIPMTSVSTASTSTINILPKFEFEQPQQQQPPRPQAMVLKRPIPLRTATKRPATFEETTKIIPVHRIKKDPNGYETLETSDPDQQQIIIYTI